MKTRFKSFENIHTVLGILTAMLLLQTVSAETQFANEFWISTSTNTANLGTLDNPYDGSTQLKFDAAMNNLPANSTIHILAGTYQTLGTGAGGYTLKSGQKVLGSGIDNTLIRLIPNSGNGSSVYVMCNSGNVPSNNVVSDLTLDASYASTPNVSYNGVVLSGGHHTVRNVKVINTGGIPSLESFAIAIDAGGCGPAETNNSEGNLVENCVIGPVMAYGGDGIAFNVSRDLFCPQLGMIWISGIIRNNRIDGAPLGINGSWMRNTLVEGNYIHGGGAGFYGDTGGYTNIIVAHNVFEDCGTAVTLAGYPRQNLMFCYNTVSSTTSNGIAWAFRFHYNTTFTNISIIGNTVTFNGNTPAPGSTFLWANDITGLIVANNTVEPSLVSTISSCTGVNMYLNYDLNGNLRTDLDTMGFSAMTSYGRSLMSSASQSAALVNLGLPSNPTILLTTNQSLPVSFTTNVTVGGALNYSNMVAQLFAGTGITTSTLNTSTGRVVTVNANSQTNGFGNIVMHGTSEFGAATNATIWNTLTVTNPTAPNWSMLSVSSSNAVLSVKGVNVAILQTNGVFNVPNGLSSTISNSLPASTVTMNFSTNPFRWTNTTPANMVVLVNVLKGSVGYNGFYIAGPVSNDCVTVLLKPGSYLSVTNNTASGTSMLAWHPF